jgi:hypothetical protein
MAAARPVPCPHKQDGGVAITRNATHNPMDILIEGSFQAV